MNINDENLNIVLTINTRKKIHGPSQDKKVLMIEGLKL